MLADEPAVARDTVLRRMMHPKSVAIIGMSAKSNTAGHAVLRNWRLNGFAGDIHLIGRTVGEIEGVPIKTDIAQLPEGIDVAVLTMPAAGVGDALAGCAARKVGAAVVFASGFAEVGEHERGEHIAQNTPNTNWMITNVLPRVNDLSHDDGLFMEYLNTSMARPPETIERLKAFLEKRAKPLAKPERESS